MCLFTHFAAGALAGGATGNVWVGAAAGLASHVVLDAIPHYDHPDWRLELLGGLLSLALLLLMPFATAAAVVGGLLGMVPDLENLFQKLGKMKRSQFIFPTHTGLIPHGRTLGPRSLVWQVLIFIACFGALALVTPGTASAAEPDGVPAHMGPPQVTVLDTAPGATRLRVDFPVLEAPDDWAAVQVDQVRWSLPHDLAPDYTGRETTTVSPLRAPSVTLALAVPTVGKVAARIERLDWWRQPDVPVDPAALVDFGPPAVYREVPVTGARVPQAAGGGVLRSVVLTVEHPVSPRFAQQLDQAKKLDGLDPARLFSGLEPPAVLNPDLMRTLAAGGRERLRLAALGAAAAKGQFNHFDLSDNWVRLEITEEGLYRLTGQELSNMGVSATGVDPLKLRLYKGGGLALDRNPERPESDQADRVGLTEVAIQVLGANDGEWNLDDEIRFYGFGSSVWLDRLDPAAGRLEHYDHPYSPTGVYWLTWEGVAESQDIPGPPLRVATVNEAPGGGPVRDFAAIRLHLEEQQLDTAGQVADNWAWSNTVINTRSSSFDAQAVVGDSLATWVIDFRGNAPMGSSSSYVFAADGYLNDDTANVGSASFVRDAQHDSLRCRVHGRAGNLVEGENRLTLRNSGASPKLSLILDSFDVAYWSRLDFTAHTGQIPFCLWSDQAQAAGRHDDLRMVTGASGEPLLWDVTDPAACRLLGGQPGSGDMTYGLSHQPADDRRFIACDAGDLLSVADGGVAHPVDLRGAAKDLHYVVIHPAGFLRAAEDLAAFRNEQLPGVASPRARAVLVDDIYDNYSGGQKDPRAIRNYLRDVYLTGGDLAYACLLGNASRDYRDYKGASAYEDLFDLVPMDLRTYYPVTPSSSYSYAAYASDDGLVSFDWPGEFGLDVPDLAVGRLPAITIPEINAMVDRVIAYADTPEPGTWRNHAMMVADDCNRPSHMPYPITWEIPHTREGEVLSNNFFPSSVDIQKVYGVDYDFPPGSAVKPQMRADVNARLNDGTTVFYYVGHGAEDNLADEQIFQSRDIANLNNGLRRPLFVAFSCDVGVYDSPIRRSMAEQFVSFDSGGAIASICASQVSFIGPNEDLSEAFFASLFPGREVSATVSLGAALANGKAAMPDVYSRRNSQRYNLFCDPAVRLPHPVGGLDFAAGSVDTLRAGARQVAVVNDGVKLMMAAGDAYGLRVQESSHYVSFPLFSPIPDYVNGGYDYRPASDGRFLKPGNAVFRGTGTMVSSELRVPFKVPTQLRYGDDARIRLVLGSGDDERVAETALPAVRSATGPVDDVHGPQISLSFAEGKYRVRPGDPLTAVLDDTSSIAILGTSPGNSILLEFDDSGFMTNVTGTFTYDPDSYQRGRLEFPLPADLEPGKHKAALHASDALGNVGSDTLSFQLVPAGVTGLADVTVFPNPTHGPCRLVFELSDPMRVRWEIFTLAGRRLKSIETYFESGGPGILEWDGRDDQGDEIANGTYLFVLRGNVYDPVDAFRAVDERDVTRTGKLVIMR